MAASPFGKFSGWLPPVVEIRGSDSALVCHELVQSTDIESPFFVGIVIHPHHFLVGGIAGAVGDYVIVLPAADSGVEEVRRRKHTE